MEAPSFLTQFKVAHERLDPKVGYGTLRVIVACCSAIQILILTLCA